MPCVPYAGDGVGFKFLPAPGSGVWVEFEGGNLNHPIWSGCFWGDDEVPAVVKAQTPETYESPRGARVGAPGMAHLPDPVMPLNLDRLTEQVVKEIDNRIVAYRERMGRVF